MAIDMIVKSGSLTRKLCWEKSSEYKNWYDHFVSGMNPQILKIVKQILFKYYESVKNEVQTI